MTSCATILCVRIESPFFVASDASRHRSLESPAEAAKTARARTFRMLMTLGSPHLGEGMRRGWYGLRISAKMGHRRPVRQNWRRRWSQRLELLSRINRLTAHDGQDRFDLLYLIIVNRDPSAQRRDSFDVPFRNRLSVVNEPVQTF